MKNLFILFIAILSLGTAQVATAQGGQVGGYTLIAPVSSGTGNHAASDGGGNNSHLLLEDDGRVYPNPSYDGHFSLEMSLPIDRVVIYNTLGQRVEGAGVQYRQGNRNVVFDMSTFNAGIYFVRVYTPQGMVIKRVVLR